MSTAVRCFENSLIIQNILEHLDVLKDLKLRLITKTFDEEVLRQLRRRLAKVRIEVEGEKLPKIRVNGCLVKTRDCFQFLISTAGVKVEELEVVRDGKLEDREVLREIHDDILDVLIRNSTLTVFKGIRVLCEGACHRCGKYAVQSKELGPVSLWGVRHFFDSPKHFDKLIVDDQLLWRIAGLCQLTFDDLAGQMAKVKSYVHSRISCDHLQILLYDDPKPTGNVQSNLMNDSLPREILEEMCKVWGVKTLQISFQSQDRGEQWEHLTEERVFSELRWDPHPHTTPVSTGFLLDHVEVDVENAPRLFNGAFAHDAVEEYHLIGNIRKVFPARKLYFNGHRISVGPNCPKMMTQKQFYKMIQAAMFGTSRTINAPLTIRHFFEVTNNFFCFNDEFEWEWDDDQHGVFTSTLTPGSIQAYFNGVERIGKTFKYREEVTGCEINLEIYVEKEKLLEMVARHRIVRMGMLRHFVYKSCSMNELFPRSPVKKTRRVEPCESSILRMVQNPASFECSQNPVSPDFSEPFESMENLKIQNTIQMGFVRCKDSTTRFMKKLVATGINAAIAVYDRSTTRAFITLIVNFLISFPAFPRHL